MPRTLAVALFFFLFSKLFAQVYHYETGKAIPLSKPGQISWKSGVYYNYPADFGTLVVLENSLLPKSRLINIPIIKVLCTQSDSALEPIFILNGGPGESNIQTHLIFSRLLEKHDIILMGYRGVDGSFTVSSNEYKKALFADSLSMNNYQQVFNRAISQTLTSLSNQKIDIQGYSLENVINDIELVRQNEQYPKISFVAYSYGTMLAQLYAQTYPNQLEKMALIGARPFGNFKINDTLFQQQTYLMFKDFKYRNGEPDSSLSDFNRLLQKVENDSVLLANKLNPVRFRIFLFSQFYSLKKTDELFAAITSIGKLGYAGIVKKYQEFYVNYPNIEMSDIFLKKQNWFNYSPPDSLMPDVTISLVNTVNHWYSPYNTYFFNRRKPVAANPSQTSTLFICAQFDIAAPLVLIHEMQRTTFLNSTIQVINHCGHLDLFYEQKPQLDSLIFNYFCPSTSNF